DDQTYTVDVRAVFGNGLTVEAGYSDYNFDTAYSVAVGTYLSDYAEIQLGYLGSQDTEVDTWAATYHALIRLNDLSNLSYTVSAGYIDADTDDGYMLDNDLTYYFNWNLGIGGTASFSDLDLLDTRTYGLHANYFFTPNFFIDGYVETTDYQGQDNDSNEDSVGIGAFVRF
ncbi:MAG: hypothetical protein LBE21_00120, partial [Pseudomonadales bacterium]|nr:hypothetical protein [Pseudomonadales bacterium]